MRLVITVATALSFGLLTTHASGNEPCELTMTYSGTLTHVPGQPDLAGLDGANFVWTGVFDPDATPVTTTGSNQKFAGEVTLLISGSTGADGVYSSSTHRISEDKAGAVTSLLDFQDDGTFQINGVTVRPGAAIMVPGFENGAPSPTNTLTPVQLSDVDHFTDWDTGLFSARYAVSNAQLATEAPVNLMEMRYSGSLFQVIGSNGLLDGADFVFTGSFDADAFPSDSIGSTDLFEMSATFTISGTATANGVYSEVNACFWEIGGAPDSFQVAAGFNVGHQAFVIVGGMTMQPGFDNGATSPTNVMTPFENSDVASFHSWTSQGASLDFYEVINPHVEFVAIEEPWCDSGCALAGVAGDPSLVGTGLLESTSVNSIALSGAAPLAQVALFVGLSSAPVPFKGGTLKPAPWFLILSASSNAAGSFTLPFVMPPGVPAATELWMQCAISDAAAVNGVALSNAIVGTTP